MTSVDTNLSAPASERLSAASRRRSPRSRLTVSAAAMPSARYAVLKHPVRRCESAMNAPVISQLTGHRPDRPPVETNSGAPANSRSPARRQPSPASTARGEPPWRFLESPSVPVKPTDRASPEGLHPERLPVIFRYCTAVSASPGRTSWSVASLSPAGSRVIMPSGAEECAALAGTARAPRVR